MTKCDRAGLQIMIGFGLPCEKKNFKNGLKVLWDYKTRRIT